MIPKSIDNITKQEIDSLIESQVPEGRTIEYKQILPGNSDAEKREFLADVSSFANAAGGDLIYGVRAVDGLPKEAIGLNGNMDAEKLRLESIMRDGIDPRIPGVRPVPIEGFSQGPVLVVRIPKSWSAPHMVTFKNRSRFYTRNSAGKYQMDVSEIRSAFLLSEALPEKIKRFRDERLARIIADETPVPLLAGPKLVLHVLPIASFTSNPSLDISSFKKLGEKLKPIGSSGGNERFNLDGFVTYRQNSTDTKSSCYCQIFRSGQIESVWMDFIYNENGLHIAPVSLEKELINALISYLQALNDLALPCSLLILISMLDVSGVDLPPPRGMFLTYSKSPIDRDLLLLPDVLIEDYASVSDPQNLAKTLRPAFDAVWNACNYKGSYNFDSQGNWNPSRQAIESYHLERE